MRIDKRELVNKINNAAQIYKNELVGRTFLVVYENKCIEIMFAKKSFLHLTGVASTLYADDFYTKASRRRLKQNEIYFDSKHPADFANIKTQYIDKLPELTNTPILLATDINTMTAVYQLGLTNLKFVLCFGPNTDSAGNLLNNSLIPYSLRIEEIQNNKYNDLFSVDFVFSKPTNQHKYTEITFGNKNEIKNLDNSIKEKLDSSVFGII